MEKPQIILHVYNSVNYTIFDAKWIPCSAKFVVLGNFPRGTGALQVYEVSHGELKCIINVSRGPIGLYFLFTKQTHTINRYRLLILNEQFVYYSKICAFREMFIDKLICDMHRGCYFIFINKNQTHQY